jgi:CTP synthase (UTP-ammonia lyase)
MSNSIAIALIGNYDASILAHQAIPLALQMASRALDVEVRHEWVPSEEVTSAQRIAPFDGVWCTPGSPYRSMDGALLAIRHARESGIPFLGTCGGFQHAVVEYARNVLDWSDADHAESSPHATRAVIAPLACGLLNTAGDIRLLEGTRLAAAYRTTQIREEYLCSYGVNPEFTAALVAGPLRLAAVDTTGDIRGVELDGHPFYVATLCQPERAALRGQPAAIATAFVQACTR